MKILILTQYDEGGASSRIRVYQFLKYLKEKEVTFQIFPLILNNSAKIFAGFARGQKWMGTLYSYLQILQSYFSRYRQVMNARDFDGVLVQKDVLPFGLLWLLKRAKKPIIFEIDDPIWLSHSSLGKDGFLKRAVICYRKRCLDKLLKASTAVIADTQPIADYAKQFCAHTWVMTSPINADVYSMSRDGEDPAPTLVWIGSPGTTYLLEDLVPLLDSIARRQPLTLLNVGGLPLRATHLKIENIGWSIANEVTALKRAWLGLMPTASDPFNDCKFGYKIWQYYAASLPVLGPNLGLNSIAIRNGITGLVYSYGDHAELGNKLDSLICNKELRHSLGNNARSLVEKEHDLKILGPKWAQFLIEHFV